MTRLIYARGVSRKFEAVKVKNASSVVEQRRGGLNYGILRVEVYGSISQAFNRQVDDVLKF